MLAATFSVLGTLPLVFLAELGFAVAFGVLLDTLVVRVVPGAGADVRHRPADLVAEPAGARRRAADRSAGEPIERRPVG